jgi:nucleotide-binding universal stress UspA family protein
MMGMLTVADREAEQATVELLDRLAAELRRDGIKVQTHVCHSAPADALVTVALAEKADVIVVGNKGMKGARRVLGSVPNSVAHHAPCAVLIVSTC